MARQGETRLLAGRRRASRLLLRCKETWPVLEDREVHWFLWGQLLSTTGSWMTRVAIGWLVFRLTGSALWLGIAGCVGQIPIIFLAPLSGVVIDRFERRQVLGLAYVLASMQALGLAGLAVTNRLDIDTLIVMSLLRGCIAALELPARQAFLCGPTRTGEVRVSALAVDSLVVNMGRLIGPSLAGLAIAAGSEASCFLFDGISYVAPILALMVCPVTGAGRSEGRSAKTLLFEGWTWIRQQKEVRIALLRLCLVSLTGLPFTVLLPAHVQGALAGGSQTLGWLVSMSSLGAILASCLAGRQATQVCRSTQWLGCLGAGACLALLGLSRWPGMSLLSVFGASFFLMWQIVTSLAVLQMRTPEAARGRISGYCATAFWGMAPFGSLLLGTTARLLQVPTAFCLSGLFCAGAALLSLDCLSGGSRRAMPERTPVVTTGHARAPLSLSRSHPAHHNPCLPSME